MQEQVEEQSDRLQTIVALLIALATVMGAVVAWRASVAADGAGDADFAGQRAMLNLEETRALSAVNAYESFNAFSTNRRYSDLGDLIVDDLSASASEGANALALSEEAAYQLDAERANAYDLAIANQSLFPNKFLNRDGTYALKRQLGELFSDAGREKDLQPEGHYAEADQLRTKTNQLLAAVTVLAVSLIFYTLVESVGKRLHYVMVGSGTLFLIAGVVFATMVEFK